MHEFLSDLNNYSEASDSGMDNFEEWRTGTGKIDLLRKSVRPKAKAGNLAVVVLGDSDFRKRSIHQFSKLVSGIFGGVAMALFVGRFQSKFLKTPRLTIILFLYTVSQALFVFYGDQSVKGEARAAAVIHIALFLKCLLILYMFWLFQSGRLLFYLVRVRRATTQVDSEWQNFRGVLQRGS